MRHGTVSWLNADIGIRPLMAFIVNWKVGDPAEQIDCVREDKQNSCRRQYPARGFAKKVGVKRNI
jgi:hypothetical protein